MVILTSFPPPTEGVLVEAANTSAHVGNMCHGTGTLYIAESRVSWMDNNSERGFSLEYPAISLHAVSRDNHVHPDECLYIMIDANLDQNQSEINEQADDTSLITEIKFVPQDKGVLDALFHAMSECQALHPDPEDEEEDSDEDEYGEDGDDGDAEDLNGSMSNGDGGGDVRQEIGPMDTNQFDDADMIN